MLASSAVLIFFLAGFSTTTTSDEPLLVELAERYPNAEIWPQPAPCGQDCIAAVASVFKYGVWRITDWNCMRENGADKDFNYKQCADYFTWELGGLMHPRFAFGERDDQLKPADSTAPYFVGEPVVFVGEVTVLLKKTSTFRLFLVERGVDRPSYDLVEAKGKEGVITELTQYPLDCAGAGSRTWKRLGYRHHKGHIDVFHFDYCEIRDLEGFRNLARKSLKRPPSAIWQRIADLPKDKKKGKGKAGKK